MVQQGVATGGWCVMAMAMACLLLGACTGDTAGDGADASDLGEGDGQDVVTIGDSWMNLLIDGIEPALEDVSGRDYRNYGVPGTRVLTEQIPDQYAQAVADDDDIKTVIMTGGGNDILFSPCADGECLSIVDEVHMRVQDLLAEALDDGVQDVVLIGYTYPSATEKHAALDHSRDLSNADCTPEALPRCHFIDATEFDIELADGIHPDGDGYDLLGEVVWQTLQDVGARR